MILTTRLLAGVAQLVRPTPRTPRNSRLTLFAVGKDFDFSQPTFFTDDTSVNPSAPEPRQNAFDRDPLLDLRPNLTGQCASCDLSAPCKFSSSHSVAISVLIRVAMG